jgi:hypothetical protein
MDEQGLREYVRTVLDEELEPRASAKQILQMIDNGPYHSMPVDELTPDELEAAETLAMRGQLRRMPADRRFPERFVLTAGGSHATDTFASDTLRSELPRRRR